ncbi:MAG: glucose-6-phosphate isomerase [Bdellovibrio sp.]|nr:glucose-6-phosphate isomerase [Bdellovibrio sp.]
MINFSSLKIDIHNPNPSSDVLPDVKDFVAQLKTLAARPDIGFIRLAGEKKFAQQCRNVREKYQSPKYFIHVGIGGSSLGPQMLVEAIGQQPHPEFIFINNIDPDQITNDLAGISPHDCLFYFVSKSGTTAETMAHLSILSNWAVNNANSDFDFTKHFIFCTDPKNGDMRQLSKEFSLDALEVPSDIGGRFSVLTPVGLLPAMFANSRPHSLLEGAQKIVQMSMDESDRNAVWQALNALLLWKNQGITQTVMMPYSSRLKSFADWFVQLWAESLGKKTGLSGREVFEGLTPIRAYGATDQHSQMQLFMEGPLDKALVIIKVAKFQSDFSLKGQFKCNSSDKLAHFNLSDLMSAELEGTLQALTEAGRPYILLTIPELTSEALGELIMFFEILTAMMGHYLNIDPFNQPGVEAGKKYAFECLRHLAGKSR